MRLLAEQLAERGQERGACGAPAVGERSAAGSFEPGDLSVGIVQTARQFRFDGGDAKLRDARPFVRRQRSQSERNRWSEVRKVPPEGFEPSHLAPKASGLH
jgi:hypothetical protein